MAGLGDKTFDYTVPDSMAPVPIGSIVRVPLHGRRVAGWVVGCDVEPPAGVTLRPLVKVSSAGPAADLVELAGWAAWRWAGRIAVFLRAASPPINVRVLGPPGPAAPARNQAGVSPPRAARRVVRLAPASDWLPVVEEVLEDEARRGERGQTLVLVPSVAVAGDVAMRLRREGRGVALVPRDWPQAAAGEAAVVVGARGAAWAPAPRFAAAVVLDAHDEAYQEERTPTWTAWIVAAERARRAGGPCVLVSPCPTVAQLAWAADGEVIRPTRNDERLGWTPLEIVDRRRDDPRSGWVSPRLVGVLRDPAATPDLPVLCVVNRKGRSRLLACAACGSLATCEDCGASLVQPAAADGDPAPLTCRRCGRQRPLVCQACGAQRFKNLRPGVTRLREELEAIAMRPVAEVTGAVRIDALPSAAVVVGTEAVLHRVERARAVAFVDFDQELLAGRFEAGQHALSLLARASRLTGGRPGRGRVLVQTRVPDHEVLQAVLHADPDRFTVPERARRAALGLPPWRALAVLSGPEAEGFAARVRTIAGIDVLGPDNDRWLVRAADHATLADALAQVSAGGARPRIEVDPVRI